MSGDSEVTSERTPLTCLVLGSSIIPTTCRYLIGVCPQNPLRGRLARRGNNHGRSFCPKIGPSMIFS